MDERFDPYYKWLGIPPRDQPAHHYRLLGIELFESDPQVIESAADRQMAHVRSYQAGAHSAQSQEVLNVLSVAKICLLRPRQKEAYDHKLRASLSPPQTAAPQRSAPGAYATMPPAVPPLPQMMPPTGYVLRPGQMAMPTTPTQYYPPTGSFSPTSAPPQRQQFHPHPASAPRSRGSRGSGAIWIVVGLAAVVVGVVGWHVWSRVEPSQRKAPIAKRSAVKPAEKPVASASPAETPADATPPIGAKISETKIATMPPMPEEKPVRTPTNVAPQPSSPPVVESPPATPPSKPTPSPFPPSKRTVQVTIHVPKPPRVDAGPPVEPKINLPEGSADYRAAYWTLALGGSVEVGLPGEIRRQISTIAELPPGFSHLLMVNLSGKRNVTDTGIAIFLELRSLESLELSDTSVTDAGLEQLWRIKGLQFLGLGGTEITDAGLVRLEGSTVSQLVLSNTKVSDEGLKNLRRLPYLHYLNLGATSLSDNGLDHFADLDRLELLVMNSTLITDEGLAKLIRHTKLAGLVLNQTGITNAGLRHLKPLTRMQFIGLAKTQVDDAGLSSLEGFSKLDQLDLRDCAITDAGTEIIRGFSNLTYVNLRGTQVTDAGLERLHSLRKLRKVLFGKARVTNLGVQRFKEALPECQISQ